MARGTMAKVLAGLGAVAAVVAAGWFYATHKGGTNLPGSAPTDAQDPNAPFVALACSPRLLDDRPALAVTFSQPVDRDQTLSAYMKVVDLGPISGAAEPSTEAARSSGAPRTPAGERAVEGKILQGSWTLLDNPRVAYFPFIQPQRRFRIEVQPGIASGDGVKLADGKTCEVASDAMSPSFYFASRGVVLPTGQNGGLPIVTVNQPEVDVQFLKVEPGELPRFFERVAGSQGASSDDEDGEGGYGDNNSTLKGRVSGWELDQLRRSTTSVYLGRFKTDDTPNRRHVTFLPVETIKELREPGVYIAVMAQPGRFAEDYQVTYFYVSDIGVHAHRYSSSLDAFATSLKTGKGLSGVEFELLDENARILGKAGTDDSGHAAFASVPMAARLLVARQAGEMTVIVLREPGLDLSEFDVGGHLSRNAKLFAYAGRDLYRPGEAFNVSVLARNADGKAIPAGPLQAVLKRPDGRTVQTTTWRPDERIVGYFQRAITLPADAQTGTWLLELRADPGAAQADTVWKFQVEEFLPERMKLDLKTAKPLLMPGDAFEVAVQGDYLFGSPAAGNRLIASVAQERQRLALPRQWPGFVFGDFADDSRKKREEVEDTALDDAGRASITLPTDVNGAQSPMLVRGSFSLLESGGRPVVRSIERSVWPAPRLLAVRPLFDRDVAQEGSTARVELIRTDAAGAFAPLASAPMRLVREDRQYYWRFDDQKGWHSGYTETDEPVESRSIALNERTTLDLPVNWGRYRLEVDDPETGLKLRYRFYAGWNAQDAEDIGNRPDRVQLKLARAPLRAGDKAEITITPPHDGTALVTVEGDKLLWSQRIEVTTKGSTIEIPIDEAWARHDLYATVTAFRPGSQGDRVTPARAVGLVHLPLARDDRKLKVAVTAPAKVLPEKRTTVKVKAEGLQGQAAYVTVSAVDVGILNITRYKTPDPVDFFFGKHRYAPELLDMYGKLIEKMEGTLGRLAFGGDANMRDSRSLPKKVRLVDLFSGPVPLNAQGEADIPLDIPDFNGTLRLMAVVAAPERFGSGEAEMVAAAPVVAELATPRFISPGDAATIALDVTNLSGAPQELKVRLEGADPVAIRDGERSVSLRHQQRTTLRFAAEATDAYGLGRLRLVVTSATGLKIERQSVLQVQPPVPQERDVRRVKLDPDGSFKVDPAWLEKYYKASAQVSLSVSNQPPLNINRLVQGLLDYPYGCLEQTTSAAYPHLFIDEAAAKAAGLKPRSRDERTQFVEGALGRLAGMQKANGGYTLWGDGPYETWLSAYVMGFLQDARAQGFTVPDKMVRDGQAWLLQQLQQAPNRFAALPKSAQPDASGAINARDQELLRDGHKRFAELAHVGYVLARDQKAPLAMLRYLHDQVRDRARSPLPLVHLSLALKLMGDANRAEVALEDAMKRGYGIRVSNNSADWTQEWLGDYGSVARDLAMSYALLVRHDVKHARRENLLFDLANRLGARQYYSTQERLALFLAARAAGGQGGAEWTGRLAVGDQVQALSSRSTEMRSLDAAAVARGVTLTSQHGQPLFVELEVSGYPTKAPAYKADVIELKREWFELDGSAWSGRPLKVGDMLIVRLQAKARQRIEDGLIVDRIPAGFEVENMNLSQGPKAEEFSVGGVNVAQAMGDPRIKHREYRDDRYVAAARLEQGVLHVFYMVRVVSPGRYVVPAAFAEDMYRPELRGVGTTDAPITIVDPRGGAAVAAAPASAASR